MMKKNKFMIIFSTSFVIDNNNFLKNDTSNFITSEAIALKANLILIKKFLMRIILN